MICDAFVVNLRLPTVFSSKCCSLYFTDGFGTHMYISARLLMLKWNSDVFFFLLALRRLCDVLESIYCLDVIEQAYKIHERKGMDDNEVLDTA